MRLTKAILFLTLFLGNSYNIFSQYITVDDTYTAQQLVQNVLVNSPCATVSNFSVSGWDAAKSYGYFTKGSSTFPFNDGIVLTTGRATSAIGPNQSLLDEGGNAWPGDNDLQIAIGENNTINATVLEFDFLPYAQKMSFEYIFSSEQYLTNPTQNQCNFSDGFAFLLKEAGSTNQYQNLAVVPNTSIPVKITTVRGSGTICTPANEQYFGGFNGSEHPTNYNGQTAVLKAEAEVTPNVLYHIKLVIADQGNFRYDSAIFLGGGSFKVGIDLGRDRLIATNNPICEGETYTLDATVQGNNTYQWFRNGVPITAAVNPTYTVTTSGIYKVAVTINNTPCIANGEVTVEFVQKPILTSPVSLTQCDDNNDGISIFNLTKLNPIITQGNSQLSGVTYYPNQNSAENQINAITNPTAYQSSNNQIIARVTNNYGCVAYATVNLQVSNNTLVIQNPISVCDNDGVLDGITSINLSQNVSPIVLTNLPPGSILEYYLTVSNAVNQTNSLPNSFTNSTAHTQIIFARAINGSDCYGIIPVTIKIISFNPSNFHDEKITLCSGDTKNIAVANGFNSYLWNTGATTSSISITQPGNYSVTVTNSFGCSATKTFTVIESSPAIITSIDINDFSGYNNSVQINVTGSGDYEYSINGFTFQDSPLFTTVPPDIYTVIVKDKNGCATTNQNFYVLDYPKYFTPNGDGINDIWEIKNLNQFPDASISIFDRYGKLIYNFKGNQQGWNGKLNQIDLLASDYWFVINFKNGKTIKGHFSLKR
jgi:gliding motility-associated-like protein